MYPLGYFGKVTLGRRAVLLKLQLMIYTCICSSCVHLALSYLCIYKNTKAIKAIYFYLESKRGKCGTAKFFLVFWFCFFFFLHDTFKGGNTLLQNHQKCPF